MNIFIFPAILALLIKATVLFISGTNSKNSKIFFPLVLIFAIHSVMEASLFIVGAQYPGVWLMLSVYYVLCIWALGFMLLYADEVTGSRVPRLRELVCVSAMAFTIITLSGKEVILGVESMAYSVTAIKGDLYFLFQALALIMLTSIVAILVRGYRRADTHLMAIQSVYTLVALLPLVLVALIILLLMAFGIRLNAAMALPIVTTLFLLITLKSEAQHKLTDVRRYIPFSPERSTSNEIMELYSSYARDEMTHKDAMNQIEKLLVTHKYDKSNGNASATAKLMGMPRSTLYSIFNRLNIDIKN